MDDGPGCGAEDSGASWWAVALSGPVVRRAMVYLVVVGGLLIAINHGDALLRGDVDGVRLVKLLLTPIVPYVVSTLSSVSAIRSGTDRARPDPPALDSASGQGAGDASGGSKHG